jgi:hypothetical protein
MNRLAKTLFLTATAAALTFSSIGAASADDYYYRRHHHGGNDALVGGAVGLATGLIVGSAIASSPRYDEPRYIDPPAYEPEYESVPVYRAPQRYYAPARYYAPVRTAAEPWTPQWERYCSYRYRSFDPSSGTYVGNDGRSHFCTAG